MNSSEARLVSIATPVYNGEAYLRECIESVINQTYRNWRYVIVDNCSTDGSLAIAREYAEKDLRITVVAATDHLPVVGSMNRAIGQVAPEASYHKPLMADDWLYPECIEKMVGAAAADPTVGLVCAYAVNGIDVLFDSIACSGGVVSRLSGRDACRTSLLGPGVYFFGSPSTMMIRADLIRKRQPFYNFSNPHADEESCYDILQESSFAFIHQVLTYSREHPGSQTSQVRALGSLLVGRMLALVKYGPVYLSTEEFAKRRRQRFREYYAFLAGGALSGAPREFWEYHRERLGLLGATLERSRLGLAILRRVGRSIVPRPRELTR